MYRPLLIFVAGAFGALIALCLHVGGICMAPSVGAHRAPVISPDIHAAGSARNRPILPTSNNLFGNCVPDAIIQDVLKATMLYWERPSVGALIHCLRLWGPEGSILPGHVPLTTAREKTALAILSDNRLCRAVGYGDLSCFLTRTSYGVAVLTRGEQFPGSDFSQGHPDQLLAALATAQVPLSHDLRLDDGAAGSASEMLRECQMRFDEGQELEFTVQALASYLPPVCQWQNRFGHVSTFNDVAVLLCTKEPGQGTCDGCHVPYALVTLWHAHASHGVLSANVNKQIEEKLRGFIRLLARSELPGGGWNASSLTPDIKIRFNTPSDERASIISNTGHHLEWIALLPEHLAPPGDLVRRAVLALHFQVTQVDDVMLNDRLTYYTITHGARALCLLRGTTAAEYWREHMNFPSHSHRVAAADARRSGEYPANEQQP